MKKVLLMFVFAAAVTAAQAQVKFGIKAGGNLSNVGGPDATGNKAMISYHAGGLVNIPVAGNFSIQPEAVFSLQGAKFSEDGDEGRVNLSYVNIPLMAKYTTDFGFFAETGPQLGLLISAKSKAEGEKEDVKELFKKTDFGWGVGVGYMSQANIGVSARYNLGLGKLDSDGEAKVTNRVLQVGVIYMF